MPCNDDRFTEHDIPDLSGYVVIVTGGTATPKQYISLLNLGPNN